MSNFLSKMKYSMAKFMMGRYGVDELSKFMVLLSLILMFVSMIDVLRLMYPVALLIMVWICFRAYSKNYYKRRNELMIYLKVKGKIKDSIKLRRRMWAERKIYKYIKCENCKTYLRVPKGKGKIAATCPKCNTKTIKKV